ncbi:MAG: hypothetical protein H8E72_03985 [Candidatus Marinimicrobia bacterium]|nr:hypothetical protein [Candidatus Neomarinimicrobiota bacterium]
MDIQQVKTELTGLFEKAIFTVYEDDWDTHPLRVVQAVKSLIGINISSPNMKLLNWVKEYISSFESRPKSELMFKFGELEETITIHSLEIAIKEGNAKLAFSHLEQLSRVSDGRPILEFLLELSAQQSGKSFLFVLSALRSNLFLSNEKITALLILCTQSILDDSFADWGLNPDKLTLLSTFELSCQIIQCHEEDIVRMVKITPWLPTMSEIMDVSVSREVIEDSMNIMNVGREGILNSIDKMKLDYLTPQVILTFDAYRAALKVAPQYTENIISAASLNIEALLDVK